MKQIHHFRPPQHRLVIQFYTCFEWISNYSLKQEDLSIGISCILFTRAPFYTYSKDALIDIKVQ
jgi:hypothetical protein